MLIQPTNYKVQTLMFIDHQQSVAVGTSNKGSNTIMVLYSVNQAGQMKTIDQFQFISDSKYQIKNVDHDKLIILEEDTQQVKIIDVEKERCSKVVFDQIITDKVQSIASIQEGAMILTTTNNMIFLVTY